MEGPAAAGTPVSPLWDLKQQQIKNLQHSIAFLSQRIQETGEKLASYRRKHHRNNSSYVTHAVGKGATAVGGTIALRTIGQGPSLWGLGFAAVGAATDGVWALREYQGKQKKLEKKIKTAETDLRRLKKEKGQYEREILTIGK